MEKPCCGSTSDRSWCRYRRIKFERLLDHLAASNVLAKSANPKLRHGHEECMEHSHTMS